MTILIFGILASILSEVISWFQKKLSGTPFQGNAAQIVIMLISIIGAVGYFFYQRLPVGNMQIFLQYAGAIYAIAQVWFLAIGQWYAVKSQN